MKKCYAGCGVSVCVETHYNSTCQPRNMVKRTYLLSTTRISWVPPLYFLIHCQHSSKYPNCFPKFGRDVTRDSLPSKTGSGFLPFVNPKENVFFLCDFRYSFEIWIRISHSRIVKWTHKSVSVSFVPGVKLNVVSWKISNIWWVNWINQFFISNYEYFMRFGKQFLIWEIPCFRRSITELKLGKALLSLWYSSKYECQTCNSSWHN